VALAAAHLVNHLTSSVICDHEDGRIGRDLILEGRQHIESAHEGRNLFVCKSLSQLLSVRRKTDLRAGGSLFVAAFWPPICSNKEPRVLPQDGAPAYSQVEEATTLVCSSTRSSSRRRTCQLRSSSGM
jgi:hypothetical protein